MAFAVVLLVAIGTAEATDSARQLANQPFRGRPSLAPGGAALTFVGLLLSVAVYAALCWYLSRLGSSERDAVSKGAVVGIFAGLIGGTVRAALVRDYLASTVGRFGLPEEFTSWTLAVFVALSIVASAAGGGAITWLSFRSARKRSPRPRS
jgi:hypothetical protein